MFIFVLFCQTCGVTANAHVLSALIGQATRRLDYVWLHELLLQMHQMQVSPNDVIIKQLEFAAQYPPTYDQVSYARLHMQILARVLFYSVCDFIHFHLISFSVFVCIK